MRVAILGCGPTGLLAAHACHLNDVEFVVFSRRRKSELFGSQYLHNPIPELNKESDGVDVLYITKGSPREYRRKVHGKWWDGHIAPEDFEANHRAWDIRAAYDKLWRLYGRDVVDSSFDNMGRNAIHKAQAAFSLFDLVVSTIPRKIWEQPGDEFIFSEGWALGDAPERGVFVEDVLYTDPSDLVDRPVVADNTIICDGTEEVPWTRLSKVFGYASLEWPHHAPQPHPAASKIQKPLHFKLGPGNGLPDNWIFVGRYGQFEKGVVVTDAFEQVFKRIQEMK